LKPKIGLMTISLPPELSTVPKEAVKVADEYAKRVEKNLEKLGNKVVRVKGQVQNEEASLEKTRYLTNQNVDLIVYLVGSWVYVSILVNATRKLGIPFVLWGIPDMRTGSLVASCINHGGLDEMGIKHEFVYGESEDNNILNKIMSMAKASMVVNNLDGLTYGLFGGRCMFMYTAMPDLVQIKKVFGIETIHLNEFWLVERAKKVDKKKVKEYSELLHKKYGEIDVPEDVEDKSIRLYFALEEMRKEYNIDFAGLKCMPEVQGDYCSHCLSVSMHLDQGFIASCEADTNAAITMQILKMLSNSPPGFGDVFQLYNGNLRLVNCGTFATKFASSPKDVDFKQQYDFIATTGPGTGMTNAFVCKPGKVTLARLARIDGDFVMQICTGEAYSQPKEKMKEARDRWPQIFIKLDDDTDFFLQNCRSNHQHWVYGEYKDELVEICKLLKIKNINT
jgi:L-fucose/D-arabinose isomerase